MAVKGIRETEKVAVGTIRAELQTWLAPQLSDISQRLTHVEARLDAIERRFDGIDKRLEGMDGRIDMLQKYLEETLRSMRNEIEARFDAIRSDIRRLDNIAELRKRWPPSRRSSLKLVELAHAEKAAVYGLTNFSTNRSWV